MNAGVVLTRSDNGISQFVFVDDIKVVRPSGTGSVIDRFGKSNVVVDEAPTAIQTALTGQLIQAVEASSSTTVFIGRTNLDRVVDDGSDQAVFVFKDETSIESTRAFSTLGTKIQLGIVYSGSGTPEGSVVSAPGALYVDTDGGAATTLYVKETLTGNTGWVAK